MEKQTILLKFNDTSGNGSNRKPWDTLPCTKEINFSSPTVRFLPDEAQAQVDSFGESNAPCQVRWNYKESLQGNYLDYEQKLNPKCIGFGRSRYFGKVETCQLMVSTSHVHNSIEIAVFKEDEQAAMFLNVTQAQKLIQDMQGKIAIAQDEFLSFVGRCIERVSGGQKLGVNSLSSLRKKAYFLFPNSNMGYDINSLTIEMSIKSVYKILSSIQLELLIKCDLWAELNHQSQSSKIPHCIELEENRRNITDSIICKDETWGDKPVFRVFVKGELKNITDIF